MRLLVCILYIFLHLTAPLANADEDCEKSLRAGARFLHQRNDKLHIKPWIERASRQAGQRSQKPVDKLTAWLRSLEITNERLAKPSSKTERLTDYFIRRYVTKPDDIPESFFDLQMKLARDRGFGTPDLTPELRNDLSSPAIADERPLSRLCRRQCYFEYDLCQNAHSTS